jgi:hypothetical protein
MKSTKFSVTVVDKKDILTTNGSYLYNDSVSTLGSANTFENQQPKVVTEPKEYLNVPYFERIPLFADPVENNLVSERAGFSSATSPRRPNNNKHIPKRPNSSRPNSSRGAPVASPKQVKLQSNTLESRILLKIASFMPDDEAAEKENTMYNRLSTSRNDLIQLNTILDEMTTEIRENDALQGAALFNNHAAFNDIPEPTMAHVENFAFRNGEIMYDTILSDLIVQAIKKINRVRKFYKNRFKQLEDASKLKFHAVEIRVEELTSALHRADADRLLYLKAANEVRSMTNGRSVISAELSTSNDLSALKSGILASDGESPADVASSNKYTSLVVTAMGPQEGKAGSDELAEATKQAQMARSLAGILQTERQVRQS